MQKTGLRDGSREVHNERNFRIKCRKQAFGTEVGKVMRSETSVPIVENGPPIRKSARA